MNPLDTFYLNLDEPHRSCFIALREIILSSDQEITEAWKYHLPFFIYKRKMFCYLWIHKKIKQPYIGLVDGYKVHAPFLLQEKRKRMKIMLIDPEKDIPVDKIISILNALKEN